MAKRNARGTETESAVRIKWADHVADHDYAAAEAYLSLKLGEDAVANAVKRLRTCTELTHTQKYR